MKKEYTENSNVTNEIPIPEIARIENLEKIIEKIQRKYGNDLEAFFRDAKKSTLKRHTDTQLEAEACI